MASEIESLKAKVITPGKLVDLYDVKEVRGKGGFATVRAGVDKKTGKQVALKILNPKTFMTSVRQSRQVFQEIEILRNVQALKNDNILHFVAAHEDVSATTGLPRLTIVTSLCDGGELFDRIVSMGHYSEKQAAELIKKLACALKQLHTEAGIVHRDIKPENVLYASKAEDAEPVIADFGLSLIKGQEDLHSGLIGTPSYLAPECFINKRYTEASDVWALGVLLYILLCGYPPFYSEKRNGPEQHAELMAQTRLGPVFHADAWGEISESARLLVAQMMTVDESRRITMDQVLAHTWIAANAADETKHLGKTLEALKTFNAKRKIKAAAVAVRLGASTNLRAKMASLMSAGGKDAPAVETMTAAFTPEKLAELSSAFNKVAGQGGSVNAEQLSSVLTSLGLGHLPVTKLFELFDEDGSGTVDYRELLVGLTTLGGAASTPASTPEEQAKNEEASLTFAFNVFDEDKSGAISLNELVKLLQMLNVETPAESTAGAAVGGAGATASGASATSDEEEKKLASLEALFHRMDKDHSGAISLEEFKEAVKADKSLADALLKPLRRGVGSS